MRVAAALRRLATDRVYRSWLVMRLLRPRERMQWSNLTFENRYPVIFKRVASLLGAAGEHRILSFGCSTGEEVFTLARYFPRATIRGVDINAGAIATANRRLAATPNPRLSFARTDGVAAEPDGAYDAIFCMAVLQHERLKQPGVTRCDEVMPFSQFDAAVTDLARCLQVGGLLAIRHSHFRLGDAQVGPRFETVVRVEHSPDYDLRLFGPDNRLLEVESYPDVAFRKLS